ncbi:MAG: AAA family ATPase, partial [Phycisphaerales bacterium]
MHILLENFRCFSGKRNRIPIRPLTILVGENSTGKTSLMAAAAALSNLQTFPLRPSFNSPPFALGSYETIASRGSRGKVADYFAIGFEESERTSGRRRVLAKYVQERGRVQFQSFSLTSDVGTLNVSSQKAGLHFQGQLSTRDEVLYRFGGRTKAEETEGYDLSAYLST